MNTNKQKASGAERDRAMGNTGKAAGKALAHTSVSSSKRVAYDYTLAALK